VLLQKTFKSLQSQQHTVTTYSLSKPEWVLADDGIRDNVLAVYVSNVPPDKDRRRKIPPCHLRHHK
jgi:hypothetical protein